MPALRNLLGQRFGLLIVLGRGRKNSRARAGNVSWVCACDCGNRTVVLGCHLTSGHTRSCGCRRKQIAGARFFKDCVGQRFGRLVVLQRAGSDKHGSTTWLCVCDCGNEAILTHQTFATGHTKSCGCLRREVTRKRNVRHGMSKTREYRRYHAAKQRCANPNNSQFANYGGRDIEFRYVNFESFFADLGYCPPGGTLERIKVNGHYDPGNCCWATWTEQANNRRNNVTVTAFGRTQTVTQWARELGVPTAFLSARIQAGWSSEAVVTVSLRRKRAVARKPSLRRTPHEHVRSQEYMT
jgi:hypothetical protein